MQLIQKWKRSETATGRVQIMKYETEISSRIMRQKEREGEERRASGKRPLPSSKEEFGTFEARVKVEEAPTPRLRVVQRMEKLLEEWNSAKRGDQRQSLIVSALCDAINNLLEAEANSFVLYY